MDGVGNANTCSTCQADIQALDQVRRGAAYAHSTAEKQGHADVRFVVDGRHVLSSSFPTTWIIAVCYVVSRYLT